MRRSGTGTPAPCPRLVLICGITLAGAALGLRPAAAYVAAQLDKHSIAPQRPLHALNAAALPSYRSATQYSHASAGLTGTSEYADLWLAEKRSGRAVQLLVTYYADPHDKVPHTPDTCYPLGGAVLESTRLTRVDAPETGPAPVRVLRLTLPTGERVMVVYGFCVSGRFCADRQEVRGWLRWPDSRFAYFAKIEVTTACNSDAEEPAALEACCKLWREAVPALLRDYFPTAEALKRR